MGDCYRGCPCGTYERIQAENQRGWFEQLYGPVDAVERMRDDAMVAKILRLVKG